MVELSCIRTDAAALGIDLGPDQIDLLARYVDRLIEANRHLNLTRIVEPADIERRHLLDSLTCALPCLEPLRAGAPWRCLDVGSGGGVPGIPLAIAFPSLWVTLIESVGKKAAFLTDVVSELTLANVTVRAARAEEAAREAGERDAYDLVVARALAPLDVALELCLPFVRPGGLAVLPRGSDLAAQLPAGEVVAGLLAARLRPPLPLTVAGLPAGRALVVADKLSATPERFPRRPGMAAKRRLTRGQCKEPEGRPGGRASGTPLQ